MSISTMESNARSSKIKKDLKLIIFFVVQHNTKLYFISKLSYKKIVGSTYILFVELLTHAIAPQENGNHLVQIYERMKINVQIYNNAKKQTLLLVISNENNYSSL